MSANPNTELLTGREAAEILGVHPNTVRQWASEGKLGFVQIRPGGIRRYRPGDVMLKARLRGIKAGDLTSERPESGDS